MDVTHCSSADIVNGLDWNIKMISICVWYTITANHFWLDVVLVLCYIKIAALSMFHSIPCFSYAA